MRVGLHRLVSTTWVRGPALAAILALAVQPCLGCFTGGTAVQAVAAPAHATNHSEGCGAPAGPMTGPDADHAAAPATADGCLAISASQAEAYVPAAAAPNVTVPTVAALLPGVAPSVEHKPVDPHAVPGEAVPLFLRHASFRI